MSQKQRSCQCCNIQTRSAIFYKPLVQSNKQTDVILLNSNKMPQLNKANNICDQCKNELQKIEVLVKQEGLKFGNGSIKGREVVSIYFDFTQTYLNTINSTPASIKKLNIYDQAVSSKKDITSIKKERQQIAENTGNTDQEQSERQSETIQTNAFDVQDIDSSTSKFPVSFSHALLNSYSGYNPQYQPFYNQTIERIIKNQQLFKSSILPLNYRYLLFMCTTDIPTSERHQRIRSTLLRVMVGHAIPLSQIKNVSILVQILLCFMRDAEVYIICGKILEQFNYSPSDFQQQEENENYQKIKKQANKSQQTFENLQLSLWKNLYSIPKCFQILQLISQLCKQGIQAFKKYSQPRQCNSIKNSSYKKHKKQANLAASQIVYFDKNNENSSKKTFNFPAQSIYSPQKKFSRRLSIAFKEQNQSVFASFNGQVQSNNQVGLVCPYCNSRFRQNNGQMLKQIERMKNYCSLIINSIKSDQQKYKNHIKEIQTRFKKEKDQYITKILNLKGKLNIQQNKQRNLLVLGEYGKSQIMEQQNQQINIQIQPLSMTARKKTRNQNQQKSYNIMNGSRSLDFTQKFFHYDKTHYANNGSYNTLQIGTNIIDGQKAVQNVSFRNSLEATLERQQSYLQSAQIKIIEDEKEQKDQILVIKRQYQALQRCSQKQEQILLTYLNRIIIQTQVLPLPEVIISPQDFLQNIVDQVNRLVQQNNHLFAKNKQSQSETRRLLSIVQRKQEKFVPLMHQKDQIIQTYQNALWRLQNGLSMNGNKLADRIRLIQKLQKQRNTEKQKAKKKQNSIHVITNKESKDKKSQKKLEISAQQEKNVKNGQKQQCQSGLKKSLNVKKKSKKTKISKIGKGPGQEQAQSSNVQITHKQNTLFSLKKEKESSKQSCIIY